MKWISVKDKLPPSGLCIIFVKDHNPDVYMDSYGEYSKGKFGFCHDLLFEEKVTHWMKLPEGPEE